MKKKDIIFIIGLCIVIGIMYLVYELTQKEKNGEIEVYYHNEVIETIDISKDPSLETITRFFGLNLKSKF